MEITIKREQRQTRLGLPNVSNLRDEGAKIAIKRTLITCILFLAVSYSALSQQTAIKTNLLYDATTTFNLGVEQRIGKKLTIDFPVNYNPWTFSDNKKLKHILVQPELRFWQCEPFNRGFVGIHGMYAFYNMGGIDLPFDIFSRLKTYRYEGWLLGIGVSYGYQWFLSPRWSLEATVGAGYVYFDYDRYECPSCGTFIGSNNKHYFGPTKAGVSLIYLFNNGKGKGKRWNIDKNVPERIR